MTDAASGFISQRLHLHNVEAATIGDTCITSGLVTVSS